MNLKFFFNKKVSTKLNQTNRNKSKVESDSSSSIEKQTMKKFNNEDDQELKIAPTDRKSKVFKERDLVLENNDLKNNENDRQDQVTELLKDDTFSNKEYSCELCNEKLDKEWKKPDWKWNMDRNIKICLHCYNQKEEEYHRNLNYCNICNSKLKFIRYNPKPEWKTKGQLCRKCWDKKNNDFKKENLKIS